MKAIDSPLTLLLAAGLVVLIGAGFTFGPLSPAVGFDDANITQAYARHFAAGHGFVYNIGGERVEGSTSLLWTLINAAAFAASSAPEALLAVLSLILTAGTILAAALMARRLAPGLPAAGLLTTALFLAFPAFFGWMVWSLMDMVLWVFLIAVLTGLLVRAEPAAGQGVLLPGALLAALLPVTRPEGFVLVLAVALFCALRGGAWRRLGLAIGAAGLLSAGLATLWRLAYFGYPAPNTFYAKTSGFGLEQTLRGARYALSYLAEPQNVAFVLACCVAGLAILRRGSALQRAALGLAAYLILGGVLVYMALGGDHFGSHRFYLYFLPVGLPLIVGAAAMLRHPARLVAASGTGLALVSGALFMGDKGDIGNEFAIAEDGRVLGTTINDLPGAPSVGVVAAGGIRMTYEGVVLDLMGLNWVAMAHAPDDDLRYNYPNHQSFNQDIFWQMPPDIFVPYTGDCPERWQPTPGFHNRVTDYVSEEEAFRDRYDLYCHKGTVLYVARDYVDRMKAEGHAFDFHKVEHGG